VISIASALRKARKAERNVRRRVAVHTEELAHVRTRSPYRY
jgi:hypothetical protein